MSQSKGVDDWPDLPTFEQGQMIRLKLRGATEGIYTEFGAVQALYCGVGPCWGFFFNYKKPPINYPKFISFETVRLQFRLPCSSLLGKHSYKIQREASRWVGYFSCEPDANPAGGLWDPQLNRMNWVPVHSYADSGPDVGWPDVEAFEQGFAFNPSRVHVDRRWLYGGEMAAPHANFRWRERTDGGWSSVRYAECRKDDSYRWNGRESTTTPPITVQIHEKHTTLESFIPHPADRQDPKIKYGYWRPHPDELCAIE